MRGQSLKIVLHTDARWSSGVESRQTAFLEGDVVIEAYELHQHIADQYHQLFDVATLILLRHVFDRSFGLPRTLGRRTLARRRCGR